MEGNLTKGPILKTLTKLAIPIMASSFLGTLYNITDMAWIGLLGSKAVAGIGVGGMFTWLSQGFASMARMGGQVQVGQCVGRGDKEKAHGYAQAAVQLATVMGLVYALVVLIFTKQMIGFFKLEDPEAYAAAYESCMESFREIYMQREDEEDLAYMNERRLNFPVSISFVVERDKKTGQPFMAERMTFEDLISFLYMDLYRGMAVGNVPRLCHNCGKWFLAIGAYDTVYCQRVAPGEMTRTCRQVGAHKKEREKNGKDFAYREYAKAYGRLKSRKLRETLSAEKWHRQVAYIQELKAEYLAGNISDVEYVTKLDQV